MNVELITLLGSTVLGGVLKLVGVAVEASKQKHLALLQALSKEADIIKETREYENSGFQWTRRLIAVIVTFAVILWPSIVPVFWPEVDIVYGYSEAEKWLWFSGSEVLQWRAFGGAIVISPLQTQLMSAIAGLYFGASIIKGK